MGQLVSMGGEGDVAKPAERQRLVHTSFLVHLQVFCLGNAINNHLNFRLRLDGVFPRHFRHWGTPRSRWT